MMQESEEIFFIKNNWVFSFFDERKKAQIIFLWDSNKMLKYMYLMYLNNDHFVQKG